MISNLDKEMEARNIESLIVFGDSTVGNPDLAYVVGTSLARGGIYLKRRSLNPALIVSNIDVGSARQGRVKNIHTYSEFGYEGFMSKYGRDEARTRFYSRLIKEVGLSGRTVIAGRNDLSNSLVLIDSLRKRGVKIIGETTPTILENCRETKDRIELEKMRKIGEKTDRVVTKTASELKKTKMKGSKLYYHGVELHVGHVRQLINRFMANEGIIAPEDTIFAPGKKSSDPHYRGDDDKPIRVGEPIVFDIFPCEPDGYWHDCTRTYAFTSPSRKLRDMYDMVLQAQQLGLDRVSEGISSREVMLDVCKFFQKHGYDTLLSKKPSSNVKGFIHGLGHGVGLTIGERPYLSLFNDSPLRKGSVVTVEPGLYDPTVGGVRIEDTVVVDSNRCESLTHVPKYLEL